MEAARRMWGGTKCFYSCSVGCELALDGKSGAVVVHRVDHGTPAHFCSKIAVGDRVVSLNGHALAETDAELWATWWMEDEDIGSPVWLQIEPCNTPRKGFLDVCLVRGETVVKGAQSPALQCCVGVELCRDSDDSAEGGGVRVAHLAEGGAAWLAVLAPAQVPPPLLAGDLVTIVDGTALADTGPGKVITASKLLAGPPFTRVHLTVHRKGGVHRMTLVRSSQMRGALMDDAVEYRMRMARMPALPPRNRQGRRMIQTSRGEGPPNIGGMSVREAAAHAVMCSSPARLLEGDAVPLSAETRWLFVALVCRLLADQTQAAQAQAGAHEPSPMVPFAHDTAHSSCAAIAQEELGQRGDENMWNADKFVEQVCTAFGIGATQAVILRDALRHPPSSAAPPQDFAALIQKQDGGIQTRWILCWGLVVTGAVASSCHRCRHKRAAQELGVSWLWLASAEAALSLEMAGVDSAHGAGGGEGTGGAAECGAAESAGSKEGVRKAGRYARLGAASLLGGALIGASGTLGAPAVVAAAGLMGSSVGSGTAAAAIGVSFGTLGAGLVGFKYARRQADLDEFFFDLIDKSPGLPLTVGVGGWLDGAEDSHFRIWDKAFCGVGQSDGGDTVALRWESSLLREVGAAIYTFVRDQTVQQAIGVAGTAVLGAAFVSMTLPLAMLQACDMIDNAWALASKRADAAGRQLAHALLQRRQHGDRPVTLVGFGLGARVILSSLVELASMGPQGLGIVETAALLGTPFGLDPDTWTQAASVCSFRLINGYTSKDWILALVYRSSSLQRKVAGLVPVELPPQASLSPALVLENVCLDGIVHGHYEYREKLALIMDFVGLSSGRTLPRPPDVAGSMPQGHVQRREQSPVRGL